MAEFDFTKLLSDPNFQSLLAGAGARLDPTGVGGALGGATQQYVQSVAAQNAIAKQEQQRKGTTSLLLSHLLPEGDPRKQQLQEEAFKTLSGLLTPADKEGLTSIKAGPNNNLILDITKSSPPANVAGPYSQQSPGGANTSTVSSDSARITTNPSGRLQLSDIVPFWRAP